MAGQFALTDLHMLIYHLQEALKCKTHTPIGYLSDTLFFIYYLLGVSWISNSMTFIFILSRVFILSG